MQIAHSMRITFNYSRLQVAIYDWFIETSFAQYILIFLLLFLYLVGYITYMHRHIFKYRVWALQRFFYNILTILKTIFFLFWNFESMFEYEQFSLVYFSKFIYGFFDKQNCSRDICIVLKLIYVCKYHLSILMRKFTNLLSSVTSWRYKWILMSCIVFNKVLGKLVCEFYSRYICRISWNMWVLVLERNDKHDFELSAFWYLCQSHSIYSNI